MRHWLVIWMLLAVVGDELRVGWTPHPDQTELRVSYKCDRDGRNPPFLAVNVWDISPSQATASVRRIATPSGQKCFIVVWTMRHPPTGRADEDSLYVGEWQILAWEED